MIIAAATDDRDHLADFSNYGKKTVDLAAPGHSIGSLLNNVDEEKKLKDKAASGGRLNVRRSLAVRD